MTGLYAQQKYSEAAPLMARYIAALEQSNAPDAQLVQSYKSYAKLLIQLHRNAEATQALTKAQTIAERANALRKVVEQR